MKVLKISDFKATCISVLKAVAQTGEPVVITLRGKPLARVEPIDDSPQARVLGGLRGSMEIRGDVVQSDFADDWDAETQ